MAPRARCRLGHQQRVGFVAGLWVAQCSVASGSGGLQV